MTDDKRSKGRPTKYTPELIAKAQSFVDRADGLMLISELALELEVSRDTIREWGTGGAHPDFSVIYEKLNAKQESMLIRGGLFGDYNANITKMMLGKHGYSDKQDVTSDNKALVGGAPMVIRLVGPDE